VGRLGRRAGELQEQPSAEDEEPAQPASVAAAARTAAHARPPPPTPRPACAPPLRPACGAGTAYARCLGLHHRPPFPLPLLQACPWCGSSPARRGCLCPARPWSTAGRARRSRAESRRLVRGQGGAGGLLELGAARPGGGAAAGASAAWRCWAAGAQSACCPAPAPGGSGRQGLARPRPCAQAAARGSPPTQSTHTPTRPHAALAARPSPSRRRRGDCRGRPRRAHRMGRLQPPLNVQVWGRAASWRAGSPRPASPPSLAVRCAPARQPVCTQPRLPSYQVACERALGCAGRQRGLPAASHAEHALAALR
jgi:hypothetical protein